MGSLDPAQAIRLYEADNPFATPEAFRYSNYSAYVDHQLVRLLDWRTPSARAQVAHNAFRTFVASNTMACVGAKGALSSAGYRFGFYPLVDGVAEGIARDLAAYVAEMPSIRARYKTFVCVFDSSTRDEDEFETLVWTQLQALHRVDRQHFEWSSRVSSDPSASNFGFSLAGHPFFVVGLHPAASRRSRRFAYPALAFNSHDVFASLKSTGHFDKIRAQVRDREMAIQGSLNPNLADFGEASEARQYTGKKIEGEWTCPFHRGA